jgi:peptide/nickel transport system substrate-binding protein
VQSKKAEHHIYVYTYAYPDPDILYPVFNSKGSLNRDFIVDPEIDAWTEQSRVEFDDAKRQALYDRVQERLVDQAHWVPLFEPLNFAAFDRKVHGGALRSDGDVDVTKIWLEA